MITGGGGRCHGARVLGRPGNARGRSRRCGCLDGLGNVHTRRAYLNGRSSPRARARSQVLDFESARRWKGAPPQAAGSIHGLEAAQCARWIHRLAMPPILLALSRTRYVPPFVPIKSSRRKDSGWSAKVGPANHRAWPCRAQALGRKFFVLCARPTSGPDGMGAAVK